MIFKNRLSSESVRDLLSPPGGPTINSFGLRLYIRMTFNIDFLTLLREERGAKAWCCASESLIIIKGSGLARKAGILNKSEQALLWDFPARSCVCKLSCFSLVTVKLSTILLRRFGLDPWKRPWIQLVTMNLQKMMSLKGMVNSWNSMYYPQ